jgi:hypothetical protein
MVCAMSGMLIKADRLSASPAKLQIERRQPMG